MNDVIEEKVAIDSEETTDTNLNEEVDSSKSIYSNNEGAQKGDSDEDTSEIQSIVNDKEQEISERSTKDKAVKVPESPTESHTEENVHTANPTLDKHETCDYTPNRKTFRKKMVLDDSDDEVEFESVSAERNGKMRLVLDEDES